MQQNKKSFQQLIECVKYLNKDQVMNADPAELRKQLKQKDAEIEHCKCCNQIMAQQIALLEEANQNLQLKVYGFSANASNDSKSLPLQCKCCLISFLKTIGLT
jgi:hypothetical protein